MDYLSFNKKRIEAYWLMLEHLSNEAKLELVERLVKSLRKPEEPKSSNEELLDKLYGAWENESETAEDMINSIRSSRVYVKVF